MDGELFYMSFEKLKDLALSNYMNLKRISNSPMCKDKLFMNAYTNSLCLCKMLVDECCKILDLVKSNNFDIDDINQMQKRFNFVSYLANENLKDLAVQTKRILAGGVE